MKAKLANNDSLVFSECLEEEDNLLEDESEATWVQSNYDNTIKNDQSAKIQKFQSKLNESIQSTDSLMNYFNKATQIDKTTTVKSLKRLTKQKQQFLTLDSKIQNISLKPSTRTEKINELVSLIETERIRQCEQKLKDFMTQLIEIADDVISQKKSLQRELENIIQLNKLMSAKLKDVEKQLVEARINKSPTSCRCHRTFSFSKNSESPASYLERFQFAKTIISSVEQLQLKKVQQQEGANVTQMPMVELLWVLKNKSDGALINISHGLLDRIAEGPTLKEWIKKIDQKLTHAPKISDFELRQTCNEQESVMGEFIQTLQNNQHQLISNIKTSKDPIRQLQTIRYSSIATFIQILLDQRQKMGREEAMANFGIMNRCLKLIEKKSGANAQENEEQLQIFNTKTIAQLIETLC